VVQCCFKMALRKKERSRKRERTPNTISFPVNSYREAKKWSRSPLSGRQAGVRIVFRRSGEVEQLIEGGNEGMAIDAANPLGDVSQIKEGRECRSVLLAALKADNVLALSQT
jgi:hypothetical protein